MQPTLLTRIRWWLEDLWARLVDLRYEQDAKVIVGLLLLVALVFGGFVAARTVARASSGSTTRPAGRIVTLRQKVRVRVHGHVVTRWRRRKVYAQAQTVLETQTIHTPTGVRLVTHPVTRYRVAYRKHVVTVHGKTRTVLQPLPNTPNPSGTSTRLVTLTREVTNKEFVTVTQPAATVLETTTVVVTETDTLPVTITVTVPTIP